MLRSNPMVGIVTGLVLLLLGAAGAYELITSSTDVDEAPVAQVRGRSLRGYGQEPTPRNTRGIALGLVLLAPFGLGWLVFGLRQMKRQEQLLREGVAVMGYLVDVSPGGKHPYVAYRFEDETGRVHDGRYRLSSGWFSEYQVGQEVTVVYDAEDPRTHLLDVDEVRRAEARGNRLAGRRA